MDSFAPERPPLQSRVSASGRSLERRKALVVDGDEASRVFAAEALHSFAPGFDVATAPDPRQALAWLETFSPDLLLSGLDASSEEHAALRETLRGDARTRGCRVLILSSLPSDDPRVERARLESDALLVKPIGLPVLLEAVRRVMSQDRSH